MKRIISLILILMLLLTACVNDEPAESVPDPQASGHPADHGSKETQDVSASGTVTLYCLIREDIYDGDFLARRNTYEYNGRGDPVEYAVYLPSFGEIWNDELEVYEFVKYPPDDVAEYVSHFSYDLAGNITEAQYEEYEEGQLTFDVTKSYSYVFNELGEISSCDYTTTHVLWNSLQYDFIYEDGMIVNVDVCKTRDGNPYGDVVQNYQFDYDEQRNLIQESILFSGSYQGFFQNQYTYDDQGRIASIAYTGNGQDGEYSSTQNFMYNDNGTMTVRIVEADEDPEEYAYYNADQFLQLDSPFSLFQKDEHGNVTVVLELQDGIRREYTYQAIEVSRADAQRYYRRWHMLCARPVEWEAESQFYYPVFFYHLIPNPIW